MPPRKKKTKTPKRPVRRQALTPEQIGELAERYLTNKAEGTGHTLAGPHRKSEGAKGKGFIARGASEMTDTAYLSTLRFDRASMRLLALQAIVRGVYVSTLVSDVLLLWLDAVTDYGQDYVKRSMGRNRKAARVPERYRGYLASLGFVERNHPKAESPIPSAVGEVPAAPQSPPGAPPSASDTIEMPPPRERGESGAMGAEPLVPPEGAREAAGPAMTEAVRNGAPIDHFRAEAEAERARFAQSIQDEGVQADAVMPFGRVVPRGLGFGRVGDE